MPSIPVFNVPNFQPKMLPRATTLGTPEKWSYRWVGVAIVLTPYCSGRTIYIYILYIYIYKCQDIGIKSVSHIYVRHIISDGRNC